MIKPLHIEEASHDRLDRTVQSESRTITPCDDLPEKPQDFSFLEKAIGDEMGWLGPYRILKLIGEGGMGLVFLAEDPRLKRRLAIKVMRPEMAENNVIRQRFLREARATAAVRSDYIVAVYDIGQNKDIPYVATDLLRGSPLDEYLKEKKSLVLSEVVRLGSQVAQGLEAAHGAGLIHRDIKPGNIWVEEGGRRVKILDFGLSRVVDAEQSLTQCGTIIGTPTYMAPEQVDGKPVDYRCDLFSLGCVLYEAASGNKPFDATSMISALKATAVVEPPHLHEVVPTLPADFCDLVMQMLAKNPGERPESATEVVERLQAIAGTLTSPRVTRLGVPKLAATVPLPKLDTKPIPARAEAVATQAPARGRTWSARIVFVAVLSLGVIAALESINYFSGRATSRPAQWEDTESAKPAPIPMRGVTDREVLFGMSAPFSGPSRELGRDMKLGIETCFREVNDQGGISGRKLRLVALDDGYQPDRALANVKRLHDSDRVFAIIGSVGTPTAEQSLPFALTRRLMYFGGLSGAPLLRADPPDRYVFNFRASYAEETAAIVTYLIESKHLDASQIAVFAQQDGYGDAGFNGVAKTLRQHGRKPEQVLRVGYARNSAQVGDAVREVAAHKEVRGVVMIATYHAAAEFIRQLKDINGQMVFANVSFVGSDALAEELRQRGPGYVAGVIVTQVVPHPEAHSSAVVKFRDLLSQYNESEQAGFVSLEGYLDAGILVEGLRRAGTDLTTESLVRALESMHGIDIGLGVPLTFGPSEHQASHKVWGTVFDAEGKLQILQLE
jgi:serine/threonine protein kinase/ABC-type branched-subunit amino acid transport system substrate-binding protein